MTFKFDNYYVLFEKEGLYYKQPAKIVTDELATIKTLGLVGKDSSFKIEPSEVINDSLGEEVILSYKNEVEINIESELDPITIAMLDSELVSLVLIPKENKVNINFTDLSVTGHKLLDSSKVLVFKPATVKLYEDVKLGNKEINPLKIKLTSLANTKNELIKEFVFEFTTPDPEQTNP